MKKLSILLITIALIAGFAACSSDSKKAADDKANPKEASASFKASIIRAYDNLEKEATFKLNGTMRMQGSVSGEKIDTTSTFSGTSTFDSKDSEIKIDMTDFFSIGNSGIEGAKFVVEQRTVDGILYMKMPDMGFGSGWIKYGDVNQLTPDQRSQNPTQYLDYLKEISSGVKKSGTEKIDGVDTTSYKGSVKGEVIQDQVRELMEESGSSESEIEDALSIYEGIDIPVQVWVDNKDRVRKIAIEINVKSLLGNELADGDSMKFSFDYTISDFGTKVDVQAPPENEILDPTALPFGADNL